MKYYTSLYLAAIIIFNLFSPSYSVIGGDGTNYPVNYSFHNYNRVTKKNVTYQVTGHVDDFTQTGMDAEIATGLAIWSSICNISFTRVTSNADLTFQIENNCGWDGGARGSSSTDHKTISFYDFLDFGATNHSWVGNEVMGVTAHEVGHFLGMNDMRGNPNPIHDPRIISDYNDQDYFRWRMSFIPGVNSGDYSNYNWNKDTHISWMDYDNDNHWGIPPIPPIDQKRYLSQYDIEFVQTLYGAPEDYVPVIVMQLGTKTSDGITYNSGAFVTTSWDTANSMCRQYTPLPDVRYFGIVPKNDGTGRIGYWRYYNPVTHDYCISSASSKAGWNRIEQLGYWWSTSETKTISIGNIPTYCNTVPQYQYYKSSASIHNVSSNAWTQGWDGWNYCTGDESISGYIVTGDFNAKTIVVEAENTTFCSSISNTTIDNNWSGFTGEGFVNVPNATGAWTQFQINLATSGNYKINIRYANGSTSARGATLRVNGTTFATGAFNTTYAFSNWVGQTFLNVPLVVGTNTINLAATNTNGLANIDRYEVTTMSANDIQTPYNGIKYINNNTILECENFDNGGEGIAYHDNDAINRGSAYRTNEGVDIENGTYTVTNVGWTSAGEWMNYTCNITAGTYTVTLYAASPNSGSQQVSLYQDNTLRGTFTVTNTQGWQNYQGFPINVTLTAGSASVLRLESNTGGYNLDKISFVR